MNKIFNKIKKLSIASLAAVVTVAPVTISLVSCSEEEKVAISSIELRCLPGYICPGEKLKVQKVVYPARAVNNEVKWEIIDCPFDGFSISDSGVISAPSNIDVTTPTMLHVKASDPTNPEVSDTIAVGISKTPEPGQKFLGFADNKVNYRNLNGEMVSEKIIKDPADENHYMLENPITLFFGTLKEEIEFVPIIAKGQNYRMRFHLHGDMKFLRTLSWLGYTDDSWTDTIPAFRVQYVQFLHDTMDIYFACDSSIHLTIDFKVWQSPEWTNTCSMAYKPETGTHPVTEMMDSIYKSYIDLPELHETGTVKQTMHDIYVFRKPYEYLEEGFTAVCEVPEDLQDKITIKPIDMGQTQPWREFDEYRTYKFDLTWQYNKQDFTPEAFGYKQIQLFTLKILNNTGGEECTCTFFANWVRP